MSANNGEMSPPAKRRRTDSDHSGVQRPQELGLMRQESVGSSFIGSASGIHFVQSVYQAVNQASPATPVSSQTPRQELVPGEEDQLLSSATDLDTSKLWKPSETTSSSSEVAFEDLVRWSQSYFDHWHPALPFLHGPDFLAYCEKISQHGTQEAARHLDAFQLAVVRSVLSTCLADRRQAGESVRPDQVPAILVFDSYENAINSIQAAIVVPPSNSSLQAVMSVQLFLVSMLRHNAASRIGGVIIRLLFQLGLHRCPCRYSAFSANERLLRKRLFWSVYCMERYLCQSLGTPVTLRDDDIDVCYLDDEQHASDDLEHGRE